VLLRTTLVALLALLPAAAEARFGPVGEVPVDGRLLAGTASGGVLVAGDGRLRRYDADWTLSLDVPLGDAADAAAGPTGLIYVTDPEAGLVRVLAKDGRQVGTLGAGELDDPGAIAAGPGGRVAVGDASGVTRYAVDGSVVEHTDTVTGVRDLAYAPDGRLFMLLASGQLIGERTPGAVFLVPWTPAGRQPSGPSALAVDRAGRLWVWDPDRAALVRLSRHGYRWELICDEPSGTGLVAAGDRILAGDTMLGPGSDAPCEPARISLRDVSLTRTRWGSVRVGFRLAEPAFVRVRIVRPRLAVHAIGRFMQKGRRHISLDSVTNRAGEEQLLHDRVTVRVHAEIGLRRSHEFTRSLPPG
jgi:hypothetical protein